MPSKKGQINPNWALVTSNMALAQDARTGGYLYIADLLVMHAFSSFPKDSPRVALLTTIVFIAVALGRAGILGQMKKGSLSPQTLTKWFMIVSTLGTATMAYRSTVVFDLYGMTNINSYICFLGLTTFATGMITSFRSNKHILYSQILTTVTPGGISLLLTPDDNSRVFAMILIFFTAFILYQGALSNKNWTELERTKSTLEDERNQLKTFVDEIPGSAAWLSGTMKIYGANQSFLDMLASHRDNLPTDIEKKIKDFLDSNEEAVSTNFKALVDDSLRTFSLQLKRYIYKKETCIFIIMIDIEDQIILAENLEAQRAKNVQASRLSSLGEMAGGIAHEINNPLAIIHGRAKQIESIIQKKIASAIPLDLTDVSQQKASLPVEYVHNHGFALAESLPQSVLIGF